MEKTRTFSRSAKTEAITDFLVTIDFDGTVTDTDITDALIKKFARPGWEETERLWEAGAIGSRECLSAQMALIDAPLGALLDYARSFSIDESFISFIGFLKRFRIPFGIVSDGFQVVIESILAGAGLPEIPVYANKLTEEGGKLKTFFPYTNGQCSSGTCKCKTAEKLSKGLPVIHIGDGRSDFCLAEKAAYVFSRGKLTSHCKGENIPYSAFDDFGYVEKSLKMLLELMINPEKTGLHHPYIERKIEVWKPIN